MNRAATPDVVRSFAQAVEIIIAEVEAWSNLLSRDDGQRGTPLRSARTSVRSRTQLARCCINIAGLRGDVSACPHLDTLIPHTFSPIIGMTCAIINAVQPTCTLFALEAMP